MCTATTTRLSERASESRRVQRECVSMRMSAAQLHLTIGWQLQVQSKGAMTQQEQAMR